MQKRPWWVACVIALVILAASAWRGSAAADDRETCKTATGDAAIEACTRAIESKKYNNKKFKRTLSMLYTNRGVEYEIKKDYARAVADHDQAINIDPKNWVPYNNRGNVYAAKQDYDHAIADFDEAIKLNPKYADALFNRGMAKRNIGDLVGSETDIAQATELKPGIGQQQSPPDAPAPSKDGGQ